MLNKHTILSNSGMHNRGKQLKVKPAYFQSISPKKKWNVWIGRGDRSKLFGQESERGDGLYFYATLLFHHRSVFTRWVDVLSSPQTPWIFRSSIFFIIHRACGVYRLHVIKNVFSYDNRSVITDGYYCLRWYKCASGINNPFE